MYIYTALFVLTFFILGACVGSFINMAVYRVYNKLPFFGNSFCDKCKKRLTLKELIPIFSFFLNKGKCNGCGYRIPKQYVLVEAITAISFALTSFAYLMVVNGYKFESLGWFSYNLNVSFIYYLVVIACLIFIFIYDLKYFEVPYSPVVILLLSYVVFTSVSFIFYKSNIQSSISDSAFSKYLYDSGFVGLQFSYFKQQVLYTLYSAVSIGAFFLFLFAVTRGRGMGFGDVYTAPTFALIATFPTSVVFIISSFIFGAIYGIFAIFFLKAGRKTAVPFAPFMVIGLVFSLTLSIVITKLYS